VQGWGATTEIAPGVKFDFRKLGSDGSKHAAIVNDAWGEGSLSTLGKPVRENRRREQGIGMHANALITFDLDEIRRAGLLPQDQRFVFRVDRAGLNDDVFGSQTPSAHLAVILSKPHKKQNVFDAILAAHVNGAPATIDENDTVYYFGGELPKPRFNIRFTAVVECIGTIAFATLHPKLRARALAGLNVDCIGAAPLDDERYKLYHGSHAGPGFGWAAAGALSDQL